MRRLIVWGAGELGGRVARLWVQKGGVAIGLTQTEKHHAQLRAAGVEPRIGKPTFTPEDLLLFSIPGHLNQRTAVQKVRELLPPARSVLISTTGYYDTTQGNIIDEETPRGGSDRAASIGTTEKLFQNWADTQGIILRVGGLYGPGRGPMAALKRRGEPRLGPPDKILPLIHYDDVATSIISALEHPAPEQIYLTVTPPCPTRHEFYTRACQQLELPQPQFKAPLGNSPAQFDVTCLRRDLLPTPAYPDWPEALRI